MSLLTRICAVVLILMTFACASPTRWVNANVAEDQWKADQRACRSAARREVNADLDMDSRMSSGRSYGRSRSYDAQMSRYTAGRSETRLFENCMARAGYRKVRISKP